MFDCLRARSSSRPRDAGRTGRLGERLAARALRRRGYRLLGRNLRTPWAEVDLLARDGPSLVVVEVKTTRGGAPRVKGAQLARLERAARRLAARRAFRTRAGAPCAFRVDLALVTLDARRPVVTIRRDVRRRGALAREARAR